MAMEEIGAKTTNNCRQRLYFWMEKHEFYLKKVVVWVVVYLFNESITPRSISLQQRCEQERQSNVKVLTSRHDGNWEFDRVSCWVLRLSLC